MKITIFKRDFEESNYYDLEGCALMRALTRKFSHSDISVGGTFFILDDIRYKLTGRQGDLICNTYDEPKQISLDLPINKKEAVK